jgi:hypothetical protein
VPPARVVRLAPSDHSPTVPPDAARGLWAPRMVTTCRDDPRLIAHHADRHATANPSVFLTPPHGVPWPSPVPKLDVAGHGQGPVVPLARSATGCPAVVTSSVPRAEPAALGPSGAGEAVGHAARVRPRGRGRERARRAVGPHWRPRAIVSRRLPGTAARFSARARDRETHSLQLLRGREVGDFKSRIDRPGPQVSRHLLIWGDARLGEVPVPLGPDGGLVAGKVERLDDRAALPAAVGWGEPLRERLGPVDRVTPPPTLPDGDGVDVEGHAQAAPGSSRLETRRATRT